MQTVGSNDFVVVLTQRCNDKTHEEWHHKITYRAEQQENDTEAEESGLTLGVAHDILERFFLLRARTLLFVFLCLFDLLNLSFSFER